MQRLAIALLLAAATPALATAQSAGTPASGPVAANAAVTSVAWAYRSAISSVLRAAEQVPEAEYGFKPTPDVRSFGQLVGHVADAQSMICAGALGETAPATQVERTATTKAALVAGLEASIAVCDRAYAQTDADALQPGR